MKKNLRYSFFFLSASFLTSLSWAQSDQFAYAITDVNKEGSNWSFLRKLDMKTGAFSDVLLNGTDAAQLSFDAATKKQMSAPLKDQRFGTVANAAFGTGVAAIAFDKKNNRLYYTPMFIDQLRYIDLKSMKVYFVNDAGLIGSPTKATDQSNIVTRMAIGMDGNGYALTNDGNQLIQFGTGKNIKITSLGTLVDDPLNKSVSIHNSCTSYGGDMIADDDGNLYIFSARNHVFKVNIERKVATYLGPVQGIPANFTVNGAVVDENNRVWISSAVTNTALYSVDMQTLGATAAATSGAWRCADLANSNLLKTRKPQVIPELISNVEEIGDGKVSLYPNPVPNKQFTLQFSLDEGNYTVQVTDVLGRQTVQAIVNLKGKGQTQSIRLPSTAKSGAYLVKVVDHQNRTVYSKKLLVE